GRSDRLNFFSVAVFTAATHCGLKCGFFKSLMPIVRKEVEVLDEVEKLVCDLVKKGVKIKLVGRQL
ncbi:MAG: hypothetical protein ACYSU6_02080, partial [Planctomycetota bacterium]